jgi:hypothetical protein
MTDLLTSKIAAVRARHRRLWLGTGICAAVLIFVVGLGIGMVADWWLDLPWTIRAIVLAINLTLIGGALLQFAVLPIIAAPDDDAVALRIEDAHPQFATRLIAAIQLGRAVPLLAGASPMLVRATVRQAEVIARDIEFPAVIHADRFAKTLSAALAALLLLIAGLIAARHDHVSGDLLARAFLSHVPVPRKTRIEMPRTDFKIARGDNVDLVADARGLIPSSGWLDIAFVSGRRQGFSLDRTEAAAATFHRFLENVQDSFEYRMHLGDNTTPWFHVQVLTPPMVTQLHVTQIYPPYTGRPNLERQLGDLSILAGSRLRLDITSNDEIAGGAVHWINPQTTADVGFTVDPHDTKHLTVEAPVPPRTTGFVIHLRDVNGLENKEPTVYRIDLVPDREPVVQITYPQRKEELVTRIARMEIAFDASDDFGITALALKYRIDDGPEQSIPLQIHEAGQPLPTHLHNRYAWKIAQLSSAATRPTLEGSVIEYWLEAVDNNNVTGPGKGTSEHFAARVVSEAEKLAEIWARVTASYQDFQQATDQQVKSHQELGNLLKERKSPGK